MIMRETDKIEILVTAFSTLSIMLLLYHLKLNAFGFVHTMSSHPDLPPVVFISWLAVGAFLFFKIVKRILK